MKSLMHTAATLSLVLSLAACGDDGDDGNNPIDASVAIDAPAAQIDAAPPDAGDTDAAASDFEAQVADFTCILDWPKVNRFRITNKLGMQAEAEAVAASAEGGVYPVGTIIQLVAGEAMVKRRAGFSPETQDWEFFLLDVQPDGTTTINMRGTTEVSNQVGTCLSCHEFAEMRFDMVCHEGHGCNPLPFTPEELEAFQNMDPRCQ